MTAQTPTAVAARGSSVWNASLYEERHSYVFSFGKDVLALLRPEMGERVLDLGCGTGRLTRSIADSGAFVAGLDASAEMLGEARRLYPELLFAQADAARFSATDIFPNESERAPFDAVFSNATLHWIPDAAGVLRSVYGVLRYGGRFVAEFGGKGNVALLRKAARQAIFEITGRDAPDRFFFPSPAEYAALLEQCGFRVEAMWRFDRPTPLEGENGAQNWLRMFGGAIFYDMGEEEREQAIERAAELLRSSALFQNGAWTADYVRLRVVARKIAPENYNH
jgi:trans-aconitate methyltransferase